MKKYNKKRSFKEIENFIRESGEKSLKKMSKSERLELVSLAVPNIINFFKKDSRFQPELTAQLLSRLENEKIAKAFSKLAKDGVLEMEIAPFLYEFMSINVNKSSTMEGEEKESLLSLVNIYLEALSNILDKRAKKMVKKTNVNKDFALELLRIVPTRDYVTDKKVMGIYVGKITRKLYSEVLGENHIVDAATDATVSLYKDIFKFLFDGDLLTIIAINILLEYKDNLKNMQESQKAVWNALTEFALTELNECKSGEIKELITHYIERRKNDHNKNKDQARRIVLSEYIDANEYSKLAKVVDKMKGKPEYKDYL